jgi:hypothetical protein
VYVRETVTFVLTADLGSTFLSPSFPNLSAGTTILNMVYGEADGCHKGVYKGFKPKTGVQLNWQAMAALAQAEKVPLERMAELYDTAGVQSAQSAGRAPEDESSVHCPTKGTEDRCPEGAY